jgi:transposase-like protein
VESQRVVPSLKLTDIEYTSGLRGKGDPMTERELERIAARRLAIIRHVEEITGNVAATCRYFGISRTLFYTWLRRYEEHGVEGLKPRSRRPHTSPHATTGEVVGKIVYLRKAYHFGPAKISMYLKRYHDTSRSRPRAYGGS